MISIFHIKKHIFILILLTEDEIALKIAYCESVTYNVSVRISVYFRCKVLFGIQIKKIEYCLAYLQIHYSSQKTVICILCVD